MGQSGSYSLNLSSIFVLPSGKVSSGTAAWNHSGLLVVMAGRRVVWTVWQIQRLNQQAEVLFGKEHVLEPNFAAPMLYPAVYKDPDEEELLGVEYAMCQSTSFTAKDYYAQQELSTPKLEDKKYDCAHKLTSRKQK
ncbi:unnamed protein product [Leuciscus chuanchicus]